MCCRSFKKKFIPFVLAFMLSIYAVNYTEQWNFAIENQEENVSQTIKSSEKIVYPKEQFGSGISGQSYSSQSEEIICFACNNGKFKPSDTYKPTKKLSAETVKVQIISKPVAKYTDEARQNQIQGTVRLRATLSAKGEVKNFSVITGLPYGLTEQAIVAAMQIKFEPAVRNGTPISKTVVLEYNFNIY